MAVVTQGTSQAVLEVAHFGNKGRVSAEQYTESLEKSLKQRGYGMRGGTKDVEGAVDRLTMLSRQNRLPGDWNALTDEQRTAREQGDFTLSHTFNQVRLLAGAGLDHNDFER